MTTTTQPQPTAADLALELDRLEGRRGDLVAQLQEAQRALTAAREGMATGTVKVTALEAAQSRVNALSGAVAGLDGSLEAVRSKLETAQALEHREAYLAAMFDLAQQAAERVSEHNANKKALMEAAQPFLERQTEIYEAVVSLRRDFLRLADDAGGLDRQTLAELQRRGADLTGAMTRWLGTDLTPFDRTVNVLHPIVVHDATSISIR